MVDENNLYDIYGHWHVPFWQTPVFNMSIVGLFLLGLSIMIFFMIKKYWKKRQISPAQKALRALQRLEMKPIHTRQDAHEAYFDLTDILKRFFQEHYGILFEAMTDQEMAFSLKKASFDPALFPALDDLIEAGTNVKYAREEALQKNFIRHIQIATTIVKRIATFDSKEK